MTNQIKFDRADTSKSELSDKQLDIVCGGARDAASGLATGKRTYKPMSMK